MQTSLRPNYLFSIQSVHAFFIVAAQAVVAGADEAATIVRGGPRTTGLRKVAASHKILTRQNAIVPNSEVFPSTALRQDDLPGYIDYVEKASSPVIATPLHPLRFSEFETV